AAALARKYLVNSRDQSRYLEPNSLGRKTNRRRAADRESTLRTQFRNRSDRRGQGFPRWERRRTRDRHDRREQVAGGIAPNQICRDFLNWRIARRGRR